MYIPVLPFNLSCNLYVEIIIYMISPWPQGENNLQATSNTLQAARKKTPWPHLLAPSLSRRWWAWEISPRWLRDNSRGRRDEGPKNIRVVSKTVDIPSRKLTYPTWGKGKSSSNMPYRRGYVSSLEGISICSLGCPPLPAFQWQMKVEVGIPGF